MKSEDIIKLKNKPHKIKKWWDKNNIYVSRVLLFYIYIPYYIKERYKMNHSKKNKEFNELECNKYLDKVMPKLFVHYAENINHVLISTNNQYCDFTFHDFKYQKLFNKKCRNYFNSINDSILKEYIIDKYEIEGYNKIKLTNWTHWKVVKEFGWTDNYDKDYDKGVIFQLDKNNKV